VKCAYVYVCGQYGMYLYVLSIYLPVSVCINHKFNDCRKLAKCEMCICVCMLAVWHVFVCILCKSCSICHGLYLRLSVVSSQRFINHCRKVMLGMSWGAFARGMWNREGMLWSGSGQLYYINTWAMIWPNVYPRAECWSNNCFVSNLNLNNLCIHSSDI
jgi:hypothetical protein